MYALVCRKPNLEFGQKIYVKHKKALLGTITEKFHTFLDFIQVL